jgi:hypothetical protein
MSVDLNLFCDPDRCEPGADLSVPFSLNDHTYASNGHIAVRVPRRPDIPENKKAPNADKRLAWDFSRIKFAPMPEPESLPSECWPCQGRGYQHMCPDCRCKCEHCGGSGKLTACVRIGKTVFDARYIETIQALPGLKIGKPPKEPGPLPFRFTGGEGLLAPMSHRRAPDAMTNGK